MALTERQKVALLGLASEATLHDILAELSCYATTQSINAIEGLDTKAPYAWARAARALDTASSAEGILAVSRK